MRFDSEVSSLEERLDLDKLIMDELHGILTTYEMRIEQENPSRKEEAFKASKKKNNNNQNSKSCSSSNCGEDSNDEEEASFVRKLKRGTGKFKVSFLSKNLIVVKLVMLLPNFLCKRVKK